MGAGKQCRICKDMGLFTSRVRVWNPADPAGVDEVEVWVNNGASYSGFSRLRLEALAA